MTLCEISDDPWRGSMICAVLKMYVEIMIRGRNEGMVLDG